MPLVFYKTRVVSAGTVQEDVTGYHPIRLL